MMIAVPGLTDAGHVSTSLTEHVDLLPTLAAAAGLPAPPQCPRERSSSETALPSSVADPTGSGLTADPLPALCTEGYDLLSLVPTHGPTGISIAAVTAVRKATFSQWPHPFTGRPSAMGYSIRVTEPNARYTEWVLMEYGNATATTAGVHIPVWSKRCAHELYLYDSSDDGAGGSDGSAAAGAWHTDAETANVVAVAANAALVQTLRSQLHAGWRAAAGPGPWPHLPPQPPPKVELRACPTTRVPTPAPPTPPPTPAPPTPPPPPTPAVAYRPLGNAGWGAPPVLQIGSNVHAKDVSSCEAMCTKLPKCNVGLFVNGTVRHGECWLTQNKSTTPQLNFCSAKPGQECYAFERSSFSTPSHP
jgi:hypothetical protein